MRPLFFILVTLFLIVIQTVVFPSVPLFSHSFDLLIINILFLSLISNRHSTIFTVIFIGAVMDSISGVPFFYYIFSYMFVYIIVHLVKQFLFKQSSFFIVVISGVSVLIQQILLIFTIFIRQGSEAVIELDYRVLLMQLISGLLFIPAGVWLLNIFYRIWTELIKTLHKFLAKRIEG